MNEIPKISKRLEAAASFSRMGKRFADVGTDHAYLPIYLCASNKSEGGVASDINEGPVNRAHLNVRGWGEEKRIKVVRTDGLNGIEKYGAEDIFILGMGGELIVKIISDAEWLKASGIRIVVQPMTHPEAVRRYFYENGFSIIDETLVEEEKIYQIICAEYGGEAERASELELLIGKKNIEKGGELLEKLLKHTKTVFSARLAGKRSAGAVSDLEENILKEIDKISAEEQK